MGKGLPRSNSRATPNLSATMRLRIPVKAKAFNLTDPGAAAGWGTVPLGGLPQGNVLILGAVGYLQLSSTHASVTTTFVGTMALGTTATADNALAGTEINIAPAVTSAAAVNKVGPVTRVASTIAEAGLMVDNTDNNVNVNLNVTIADAGIAAAANAVVDGYVDLVIAVLGDD
jgi:hypothetical protein